MFDLLAAKLRDLTLDPAGLARLPEDLRAKVVPALIAEAQARGLQLFGLKKGDVARQIKLPGPATTDLILKILRFVHPVLVLGDFALVVRYPDVVEVLSQGDVFAPTIAEELRRVTGNDFLLGMDDSADYLRDQALMRLVIRRDDIATRVVPFAQDLAEKIVAGAGSQLEVVGGLLRAVPSRWVGDYFGAPGPSPELLTEWSIEIFNYLAIPAGQGPPIPEPGAPMRAYLDGLIAARRSVPGDDVLGRLLALQKTGLAGLADDRIRSNLVGMISGTIPPIATVAALALDELLDRPAELHGAQQAARAGDDALLSRYIEEAMRFRPIGPGVLRRATRDFVAGRGHWYETIIPKGTTVMAATQSAMFDEHLFPDPTEFRIDRDQFNFLVFGSGQHTCFGQYVVRAMIPRMLKPLLCRSDLRRAPGAAGKLQMQGIQAGSLTLTFGN